MARSVQNVGIRVEVDDKQLVALQKQVDSFRTELKELGAEKNRLQATMGKYQRQLGRVQEALSAQKQELRDVARATKLHADQLDKFQDELFALKQSQKQLTETTAKYREELVRTKEALKEHAREGRKAKRVTEEQKSAVEDLIGVWGKASLKFLFVKHLVTQFLDVARSTFEAAKAGAEYNDMLAVVSRNVEGFGRAMQEAREATKGTIGDFQLVKSSALMSSFGLDMSRLGDVMERVTKASVATGQEVGFLMDSFARGVSRQSALILDNLGIQVSIRDAYEKHAAALGVMSNALTDAEKKAAVMNETLRLLDETTRNVDLADSDALAFKQMETSLDNLGLAMKRWAADVFNKHVPTQEKLRAQVRGYADVLDDVKGQLQQVDYAVESGLRIAMKNLPEEIRSNEQALALFESTLRESIESAKVGEIAFLKLEGASADFSRSLVGVQHQFMDGQINEAFSTMGAILTEVQARISGMDAAARAAARTYLEQEAAASKLNAELTEQVGALSDQWDELRGITPAQKRVTAATQAYEEAMKSLREAEKDGAVTRDDYNDRLANSRDRLRELIDATNDLKAAEEDLARNKGVPVMLQDGVPDMLRRPDVDPYVPPKKPPGGGGGGGSNKPRPGQPRPGYWQVRSEQLLREEAAAARAREQAEWSSALQFQNWTWDDDEADRNAAWGAVGNRAKSAMSSTTTGFMGNLDGMNEARKAIADARKEAKAFGVDLEELAPGVDAFDESLRRQIETLAAWKNGFTAAGEAMQGVGDNFSFFMGELSKFEGVEITDTMHDINQGLGIAHEMMEALGDSTSALGMVEGAIKGIGKLTAAFVKDEQAKAAIMAAVEAAQSIASFARQDYIGGVMHAAAAGLFGAIAGGAFKTTQPKPTAGAGAGQGSPGSTRTDRGPLTVNVHLTGLTAQTPAELGGLIKHAISEHDNMGGANYGFAPGL